jgi:hypothetical protein
MEGDIKMKKLVFLLMPFLLSGCIAIAANLTKMNTEKTQAQERVATKAIYTKYTLEMQKLNFNRERAGLRPQSILTLEQWEATK